MKCSIPHSTQSLLQDIFLGFDIKRPYPSRSTSFRGRKKRGLTLVIPNTLSSAL